MAKHDSETDQSPVASNYIVELKGSKRPSFLVCEPVMVISGDETWGGLTVADIAGYIERNHLRAAPLPGRPLKPQEFRSGPGQR